MATEPEKVPPDWTSLPDGTFTESLWACLHDGSLLEVRSDTLECTLKLRFEVEYLREFHNLAKGATFDLRFSGVQSVRSLRYRVWPGAAPKSRAGMTSEAQSRLLAEYPPKYREESEDWSVFEDAVKADAFGGPEVSDAKLALGQSGVALRMGLLMPDGGYRDVFIRASSLGIVLSDGRELTLEEFLCLGRRYWDAFAARREK